MTTATTSLPRQVWRLFRVVTHIVYGVVLAATIYKRRDYAGRQALSQYWSNMVLGIFDIRVEFFGEVPSVPQHGKMIVSNHVSWLDIFVIQAWQPVRFVAKSEVRNWPLLGWMCANTGTLFVERGRKRDSTRVNSEIHQALQTGNCVCFFPEGTTTDGSYVYRFNPTLMQPAAVEGVPVYPVGVRYRLPDGSRCAAAAYIDDMSIAESMMALAKCPRLVAELHFAPSIEAQGKHRRELAVAAEQAIARTLCLEVRDRKSAAVVDPQAAAPTTALPTGSPNPAPADPR